MVATQPLDVDAAFRGLMAQRRYFDSGATRTYVARRDALKALKASIRKHESAVLGALHKDLRKPALEAYISELGLVYQEIDHALDNLKEWMRPEPVPTPLALQLARSVVQREPLGVVLIIAPWNYPWQLVFAPLIGALAAGNCALLKPSEDAQHTAIVTELIVREAFPPELVSVVQGAGAEVVPQLVVGFRFDHIFFTGSHPVGRKIMAMAAPQLIPVTLELGGKSPAIIDRKVDLKSAAKRIAWGKYFNAGQTCISPDHVLVHADRMDEFLDVLIRTVQAFYGDDPQRSPDYARIINAKRFAVLTSYLDQGTIHLGGQHDAEDLYIAPTVLVDVPLRSAVMQDEIFGPVLPVLPWREREEVLEIVARNPFPLSTYVFSKDHLTVTYFMERIAFGGGCVNNCLAHFGNPELPLGGIGTSGMGNYHGRHSFEVFSHRKSIVESSTLFDPGVQYPPYSSFKEKVVRRVL